MSCDLVVCKGGVFVLWGVPAAEDMDRIASEVHQAATANQGKALFVARVPEGAPPPGPAARARMNDLMPGVVPVLSTYHVIMEGSGFAASLKRATLTSLLQPFWRRRMIFVHREYSEILADVDPAFLTVAKTLLHLADVRGLLQRRFNGTEPPVGPQ